MALQVPKASQDKDRRKSMEIGRSGKGSRVEKTCSRPRGYSTGEQPMELRSSGSGKGKDEKVSADGSRSSNNSAGSEDSGDLIKPTLAQDFEDDTVLGEDEDHYSGGAAGAVTPNATTPKRSSSPVRSAEPPASSSHTTDTSPPSAASSSTKKGKRFNILGIFRGKKSSPEHPPEPPKVFTPDEHGNPTCIDDLTKELQHAVKKAKIPVHELTDKTNWNYLMNCMRFLRLSTTINYTTQRTHVGRYHRYSEAEEKQLVIPNAAPDKLWDLTNMVGKGAFGVVFVAKKKDNHYMKEIPNVVAIKRMLHSTLNHKRTNLNELRYLSRIQHSNIVKYYCSYTHNEELWLLLENMEGGTLAQACKDFRFQEKHIAYTAKAILRALRFLHRNHIVHRDLKSENIMLTIRGRVKIIDFGLAEDVSNGSVTDIVGSPFWMPPEMIALRPHGAPADIWSFAISLVELANSKPPNRSNNLYAMYHCVTAGCENPVDNARNWSSEFKDFLAKCLHKDPFERATADQLLKHPFLNKSAERREMKKTISSIFIRTALEDSGLLGI